MNNYIKEAKRYYEIAVDEVDKSKNDGKIELAVDGCDKGWLALNLAIKAMFLNKGIDSRNLPRSYRGMRYFLMKYGDKKIRDTYNTVRDVLHIDGFWERDVDYERILECLEDIESYINQVETSLI